MASGVGSIKSSTTAFIRAPADPRSAAAVSGDLIARLLFLQRQLDLLGLVAADDGVGQLVTYFVGGDDGRQRIEGSDPGSVYGIYQVARLESGFFALVPVTSWM